MNEEFYYNLQQSIEGRCAWNSADNCCRGIEEAYKAGAAAMKERCAEVAEKQEKQLPSSCHMRDFHAEGYNDACEDIAAAIRGMEI